MRRRSRYYRLREIPGYRTNRECVVGDYRAAVRAIFRRGYILAALDNCLDIYEALLMQLNEPRCERPVLLGRFGGGGDGPTR